MLTNSAGLIERNFAERNGYQECHDCRNREHSLCLLSPLLAVSAPPVGVVSQAYFQSHFGLVGADISSFDQHSENDTPEIMLVQAMSGYARALQGILEPDRRNTFDGRSPICILHEPNRRRPIQQCEHRWDSGSVPRPLGDRAPVRVEVVRKVDDIVLQLGAVAGAVHARRRIKRVVLWRSSV